MALHRIMAHVIRHAGHRYPMHIAELDDTDGTLRIYPYTGEIHSTRFINGEVTVSVIRTDELYQLVISN